MAIRTFTGTLDGTTVAQRVVQVQLLTPADALVATVFDPALGGKVIPILMQMGTFAAGATTAVVAANALGNEMVEYDNTTDITLANLTPLASNRVTNHGPLAVPGLNAPPLPPMPAGTQFFFWFWDGAAGGARATSLKYRVTVWNGSRSISTS